MTAEKISLSTCFHLRHLDTVSDLFSDVCCLRGDVVSGHSLCDISLKSCKNILVSSLSKFTPNVLRQEERSQTKPDARKASDDEEICAQTESERVSANPARIHASHGAIGVLKTRSSAVKYNFVGLISLNFRFQLDTDMLNHHARRLKHRSEGESKVH